MGCVRRDWETVTEVCNEPSAGGVAREMECRIVDRCKVYPEAYSCWIILLECLSSRCKGVRDISKPVTLLFPTNGLYTETEVKSKEAMRCQRHQTEGMSKGP